LRAHVERSAGERQWTVAQGVAPSVAPSSSVRLGYQPAGGVDRMSRGSLFVRAAGTGVEKERREKERTEGACSIHASAQGEADTRAEKDPQSDPRSAANTCTSSSTRNWASAESSMFCLSESASPEARFFAPPRDCDCDGRVGLVEAPLSEVSQVSELSVRSSSPLSQVSQVSEVSVRSSPGAWASFSALVACDREPQLQSNVVSALAALSPDTHTQTNSRRACSLSSPAHTYYSLTLTPSSPASVVRPFSWL
jgi:hypothetical protein